jgi:hypothetical protein
MRVIRMWYGTVFWHGGWGNLEGVVFVNFVFRFIRHYSTTLYIYISYGYDYDYLDWILFWILLYMMYMTIVYYNI